MKTITKLIFASAVTLASLPSFADITQGPYVGGGLGATIAHHTGNRFSFTAPNPNNNNNFSVNLSSYAPAFNLLAGYAWKVHNWHLGAEIDYVFGGSSTTKFSHEPILNALSNPSVIVKSSGALGAGFRVGYYWDRILGFIRLGIERRTFKMNGNVTLTPGFHPNNTLTASVARTAFAPGLGLQFSIVNNISATLEYRTAFYRRTRATLTSSGVTGGETMFQIKPRMSTILASFRYHF